MQMMGQKRLNLNTQDQFVFLLKLCATVLQLFSEFIPQVKGNDIHLISYKWTAQDKAESILYYIMHMFFFF